MSCVYPSSKLFSPIVGGSKKILKPQMGLHKVKLYDNGKVANQIVINGSSSLALMIPASFFQRINFDRKELFRKNSSVNFCKPP